MHVSSKHGELIFLHMQIFLPRKLPSSARSRLALFGTNSRGKTVETRYQKPLKMVYFARIPHSWGYFVTHHLRARIRSPSVDNEDAVVSVYFNILSQSGDKQHRLRNMYLVRSPLKIDLGQLSC